MTDEPLIGEVSVARNSDNTLQRKCVPLIFLPGVMGTRLNFDNGGSWDPGINSSTIGLIFKSMESEANELDYRIKATLILEARHLSKEETARKWGSIHWDSYGKFLRYLTQSENAVSGHQCPVYALGYDWRQNVKDIAMLGTGEILSAEARVLKILEDNKAEKCVLITHSMGGLVARYMLKNSTQFNEKIAAVVHVAQPVNGAVTFYTRFFNGTQGGFAISRIMGNTPEKFARLLSVIASTSAVIPNNQYRDIDGNDWIWRQEGENRTAYKGDVYSLYAASTSPPALVDPLKYAEGKKKKVLDELARRIADAKAFHENLGQYKHDKTWAICGTGEETDVGVTHYFKRDSSTGVLSYDKTEGVHHDKKDDKPKDKQDGDGTVPTTSASALYPDQHSEISEIKDTTLAVTRQYEAKFEHGNAFKSDEVQEGVLKIIRYALTGSSGI